MNFILRTIFNFIKFAILSAIIVCICIVVTLKSNINVDISYSILCALIIFIAILMIFFAYKRHYIVFDRGNRKQNVASAIFILAGLLWMKFVTDWGIIYCYLFTVKHYMG